MCEMCFGSCVSVQRFSLGIEGSLGVFVKREVGSSSVTVIGMCGRWGVYRRVVVVISIRRNLVELCH